jgi:hypothetical protein
VDFTSFADLLKPAGAIRVCKDLRHGETICLRNCDIHQKNVLVLMLFTEREHQKPLNKAAASTGIDCMIVGATARDILLTHVLSASTARRTLVGHLYIAYRFSDN